MRYKRREIEKIGRTPNEEGSRKIVLAKIRSFMALKMLDSYPSNNSGAS